MLFNSTLTVARISRLQVATLKNSLMDYAGISAAILKIFFISALLFAVVAAVANWMLFLIFYQDCIPYGLPGMQEVSHFMQAPLPSYF